MNLYIRICILSLMTCGLDATLLVVKQENNHFVSLDSRDDINKKLIADIFLKYEWPMVITNGSLTEDEKNELLTSDQEYAEEKFIRKQLKKIDSRYDVVFIPTSLYELFIINRYYDYVGYDNDINYDDNNWYDFFSEMYDFCIKYIACPLVFADNYICLDEVINDESISNDAKYEKIYSLFKKINNKYYPQAFLYFNNALTNILFETYPEFALSENGDKISKKIENNSDQVATFFIDAETSQVATFFIDAETSSFGQEVQFCMISQVISIEYEARKLNKALLLRGTSKIVQCIEDQQLTLIGCTMQEPLINQELYFCKASIEPYSISFGNSLFAGYLRDPFACACIYLKIHEQGYSLFINKKDYTEHQCSDLFYIAPLNPIAGLFGCGEWFHSRSKAVITCENKCKYFEIKGIGDNSIIDSAGIILVTRDPLEHAELFAQYVADNMRLISIKCIEEESDKSVLTLENYQFNQDLLAKYFAIMRIIHESMAQPA